MKKIILLLVFLSTLAFANELKTVYSYQNALHKAKQADKKVMIMMSYSGCPVCDHMKDIVFERPAVLEYLNKHFFVVIKDIEKDKYPHRFASIKSPTFFFIDPTTKEELIDRKVGGFMPEEFLDILKIASGDHEAIKYIATTEANITQTIEQNQTIEPCEKTVPCKEKPKMLL